MVATLQATDESADQRVSRKNHKDSDEDNQPMIVDQDAFNQVYNDGEDKGA